jgi:hypothetical protein
MTCVACGTLIGRNARKCPNCGRSTKSSSRAGNPSSSGVLDSSPSQVQVDPRSKRDLQEPGQRKTPKAKKARAPVPAPPSPPPVVEEIGVVPELAEIREWIQECPDRLEPGLSIYTDAKAYPVGLDFSTDVGEIDVLGCDDNGGLVVVLVSTSPGDGTALLGKDLVSDALELVGWVRKHIAEPSQEVRAIVLIDEIPEDFSYAAAAVSSTLAFKTYRMEISFTDVQV